MRSSYQPSFTLRQLAHFVAAAEHGTLVRAAESLHLSQSAISASITELERALDSELCVRRKGQGMTLTPTGTQVLAQAKKVLEGAAELDYAAHGQDGELAGPLAIGSYVTVSSTVLPPLLETLSAQHPNVAVRLTEGTQDQLEQGLAAGELDVVVTYDHNVPPWAETETLYSERPYVLLGSDHPLAAQRKITLEDLAPYPMVLFDVAPSGANALSIFASRDLAPVIRYRTQTYELTRSLVARGQGYAMLIHRPKNRHSAEGLAMIERQLDPLLPESHVVLRWSATSTLSPRAAAFIQIARDHYRKPSHRAAKPNDP